MSQKIINTKNILKIILLVLIIFSVIKSCSKAYSFEEMLEYATMISNNTISGGSTSLKRACDYLITNANNIRNSVDVSQYNSFVLVYGTGDPAIYFEMYSGTTNFKTAKPMRSSGFSSAKYFGLYSNRIGTSGNGSYLNNFSWERKRYGSC